MGQVTSPRLGTLEIANGRIEGSRLSWVVPVTTFDIEIEMSVELAGDLLWGTGNWGKLGPSQMEQMVHHLREVHRLKQEGTLRRNDAGIATAKEFTWRRTADAVLRAVQ